MIMARSRTIAALALGMIFAWTFEIYANDGLDEYRYQNGERPPVRNLNSGLRENQRIKANPLRRSSAVSFAKSPSVDLDDKFHNSNVAKILLFEASANTAEINVTIGDIEAPEVVETVRRSTVPVISASHRKTISNSSAVFRSASSCSMEEFFAERGQAIAPVALQWTVNRIALKLTSHAKGITGIALPFRPSINRTLVSLRSQYIDASFWIEDKLDRILWQQAIQIWHPVDANPIVQSSNIQTFVFETAESVQHELLIADEIFDDIDEIELIETVRSSSVPARLAGHKSIVKSSNRSQTVGLLYQSVVRTGEAVLAQMSYWMTNIAYRAESIYESLEHLIFGTSLGRIWDHVVHWSDGEMA